ncbi:MAG: hypothetical protein ABIO85_06060 [Sphingomicrobium sp.]
MLKRTALLLLFTAPAALAAPAPAATTHRCPGPRASAALFASFAHQLLDKKDARGAYLRVASPKMAQHNPPFGLTRGSTITQWETMTGLAGSHFAIKSISFANGVGTLIFEGVLDKSKPGALVTQHDRFACGRIVDERAEFKLLG